MYIQFLAHYAPDAGSDLADLCLDISSIIMERSTLLPAVLPGTLCKTPVKAANDTYAALLRLFIYFMGHVRRRADQPAATQWGQGEAQEHILVKWNSSNEKLTATIHFFIVHAQVSLYSCSPINYDPNSNFLPKLNWLFLKCQPSDHDLRNSNSF